MIKTLKEHLLSQDVVFSKENLVFVFSCTVVLNYLNVLNAHGVSGIDN